MAEKKDWEFFFYCFFPKDLKEGEIMNKSNILPKILISSLMKKFITCFPTLLWLSKGELRGHFSLIFAIRHLRHKSLFSNSFEREITKSENPPKYGSLLQMGIYNWWVSNRKRFHCSAPEKSLCSLQSKFPTFCHLPSTNQLVPYWKI